jgi:putative ABC transport system substrate-binding protein
VGVGELDQINFGFLIFDFGLGETGMSKTLTTRPQKLFSDKLKSKIRNPKWTQLVALAAALALCGPVAAAQQAKVFKIGELVFFGGRSVLGVGREQLRRELRQLGYVEGKNLAFESRYAESKLERLPALADELVRLKVDVLVTPATPGALAFKNATKTIPIVFTAVSDPISAGLIDSLARPGGNITGFTEISEVLAGKRLELLKDTVPKLSRVAVLWNPQNPGNVQQWKEIQLPARALGLQLHSMEVSSADKFESAFTEAIKARSAALSVTSASINNSNHKRIADLAIKHRLPAISRWGEFVASGGLMSYGPDETESYKRVAYLIDRVLKGTKPADLPVERPMGFEFILNLKTAEALKLTIPPIVLMRVTKAIQ